MVKWIFLLSATLFAQARPIGMTRSFSVLTVASNCLECANASSQNPMEALKRFAEQMETITGGVLDIEAISDKMDYAPKCDNFVGNGEVNKWGAVVRKELDKNKYNLLLDKGPKDITQYCPNYPQMSEEDRKALFILTLTAMAHYESSCNFREKGVGPNGTTSGLLQLHKGHEARYSEGCRNGDAETAERSLICGLSMLNDQIVSRGERLFSSGSYWEVLRPRGRSQKAKKIIAAIKKFPVCSDTSAPPQLTRAKPVPVPAIFAKR